MERFNHIFLPQKLVISRCKKSVINTSIENNDLGVRPPTVLIEGE